MIWMTTKVVIPGEVKRFLGAMFTFDADIHSSLSMVD